MINTVTLLGFLQGTSEDDEVIRYLQVERSYKNNKGEFENDIVPCIPWYKKKRGELYSFNDGSLVSIKGRVELYKNRCVIVVEEIDYLGKRI